VPLSPNLSGITLAFVAVAPGEGLIDGDGAVGCEQPVISTMAEFTIETRMSRVEFI